MKRGMKSIRNTMRVKQMFQYINEHYWEDFTVKDIAEYVGVRVRVCDVSEIVDFLIPVILQKVLESGAGSLRENTEKFPYKFFEFPHNNSKAKT